MAQHDYNIANASGAAVRADINALVEAIATGNSGAAAPSALFPYMPWFDTTNGLLKRRNGANTAWDTELDVLGALKADGSNVPDLAAFLANITGLAVAEGDTLYVDAAGQLARLGKGASGQVLKQNAALTAPEWGAPGLGELIGSGIFAGDASLDLTDLDDTDVTYELQLRDVRPQTDGTRVYCRISPDNLASEYSNYTTTMFYTTDSGTSVGGDGLSGGGNGVLCVYTGSKNQPGNDGTNGYNANIWITNISDANKFTQVFFQAWYQETNQRPVTVWGSLRLATAATDNAFRFVMQSGTILEGKWALRAHRR